MYLSAICMSSLEKCLCRPSHPIFVWILFLILSCLSILEINPLSVASFANISSHSESCLLVLFYLWFPLLCQKLLNLIRSYLFIFVFIFTTLGSGSKKILLQFMSKNVFHVFL